MFLTLEVFAMIITGSAAIISNALSPLSWLLHWKFLLLHCCFCCRNCKGSRFSIILWCLDSLFCVAASWGGFISRTGLFPFLWCCSSYSCSSIAGIFFLNLYFFYQRNLVSFYVVILYCLQNCKYCLITNWNINFD